MKNTIFTFVTVAMMCGSSMMAASHTDFEGVWTKNSAVDSKSFSEGVYKIIVDGRLRVLWIKEGVLNGIHGGEVRFDGDRMIERPFYSRSPENSLVGRELPFTVQRDGRSFLQSGIEGSGVFEQLEEQWNKVGESQDSVEGVWLRKGSSNRVWIKMIVDGFWNWVVVNTETGVVERALGGSYELRGNRYAETAHFKYGIDEWDLVQVWRVSFEVKDAQLVFHGRDGQKQPFTESWTRLQPGQRAFTAKAKASDAEGRIVQTQFMAGTWVREQVNAEGERLEMTKQVRKDRGLNRFVEEIKLVNLASNQLVGHREIKFGVSRAANGVLRYEASEARSLLGGGEPAWQPAKARYLLKVDEYFWTEVFNRFGAWEDLRFTRVQESDKPNNYIKLAQRKMRIFEPYVGIWVGSQSLPEDKAYNIRGRLAHFKHTVEYNKDRTLIHWHWDGGDDFDAYGIQSYDSSRDAYVMSATTSTGVHVTGTLISANNRKFLYQRQGDGPVGHMQEQCLIDLSQEGILRHVIIDRKLNSILQPQEPEIILKKEGE